MGVGIKSTEARLRLCAKAAVPRPCARIGGSFLIRSVRWYDSSHPSLANTLKDLGDQAKYRELATRRRRAPLKQKEKLFSRHGSPQALAARQHGRFEARGHQLARRGAHNVSWRRTSCSWPTSRRVRCRPRSHGCRRARSSRRRRRVAARRGSRSSSSARASRASGRSSASSSRSGSGPRRRG